jgi:DNA (cytosine-5)-methyltransferase 1
VTEVVGIDLFCGAGGLTHGLICEGIKIVAGVDVDAACKHPFEANNSAKFIKKDVGRLSSEQLDGLFGASKIKV